MYFGVQDCSIEIIQIEGKLVMKKLEPKTLSFAERSREFAEFVESMSRQGLNYTQLWNVAFGVSAKFSQLFPQREDRQRFMESAASKRIDAILAAAPHAEPNPGRSSQMKYLKQRNLE
jgi:hypothetical protein